MSKATHFYQEAIKLARTKQMQNKTSLAIGSAQRAPTTAEGWISAFGVGDEAPGGGPAYVTETLGDAATGAIGVSAVASNTVSIVRPAYLELEAYQAIVERGRVTELKL